MSWELIDRYPNGEPSCYREKRSGTKVWRHGQRWVSSPFGMMLRGDKGGLRLFRTAEHAARAALAEIQTLAAVKSPYFSVSWNTRTGADNE